MPSDNEGSASTAPTATMGALSPMRSAPVPLTSIDFAPCSLHVSGGVSSVTEGRSVTANASGATAATPSAFFTSPA